MPVLFVTAGESPPILPPPKPPNWPNDDAGKIRTKYVCEGMTGRIVCAEWANVVVTQVTTIIDTFAFPGV